MRSTSACGVGTQTTSLPGWPTRGSNFSASAAPATMTTARHESASDRVKDCENLITVSNECATPCAMPRELPPGADISDPGKFCQYGYGAGAALVR